MNDQTQIQNHLAAMQLWDVQGVAPSADTAGYIDNILAHWVPLAEHLGMYAEQSTLQNLAVKLGYPEDYHRLESLLQHRRKTCEIVFQSFALPLRSMLDEMGIEYELTYRMKSIYSVWRKMRVDHKDFNDVYDLFAARIVYKTQPTRLLSPLEKLNADPEIAAAMRDTVMSIDPEHLTCWRIYAIVATLYPVQTTRIKNWIKHPKPSGYQALQLTVKGPSGNWIEVQVRSERMHYEAELGKAAHWLYKRENPTH